MTSVLKCQHLAETLVHVSVSSFSVLVMLGYAWPATVGPVHLASCSGSLHCLLSWKFHCAFIRFIPILYSGSLSWWCWDIFSLPSSVPVTMDMTIQGIVWDMVMVHSGHMTIKPQMLYWTQFCIGPSRIFKLSFYIYIFTWFVFLQCI